MKTKRTLKHLVQEYQAVKLRVMTVATHQQQWFLIERVQRQEQGHMTKR